MKLNKLITFSLIALLGTLATSCDDDIDINAPYEDVAVVYCLLDPDSTRQYLRINRLFQSDGSAEEDAKNRSLHEYETLEGFIAELNDDGSYGETFALQVTEDIPKDSGLFFYPDQKLYFIDGTLNPESTYELRFTKPNGDQVSGQTALVRKTGQSLSGVNSWVINGVPLMSNGGIKESIDFEVLSPINAKGFELSMEFTFEEEYANNTSQLVTINIPIGTFTFDKVRSGVNIESKVDVSFNPLIFYERISAEVPIITGNESPQILRRKPIEGALDMKLSFLDQDLDIYIEVTRPSTSLLEDKPPYTNVSNGIGIIASRTKDETEFALSSLSYDELTTGVKLELTGGRGFCNPRRPAGDPVGTGCN